jgi:hypothetical protein
LGCGFIAQPDPTGSFYVVTTRGRVFFELCREVIAASGSPGPELGRILELLGLSYSAVPADATLEQRANSRAPLDALTARVIAATGQFGVDLQRTGYYEYWTGEHWPPTVERPLGPTY